jgi:hypothetical protein
MLKKRFQFFNFSTPTPPPPPGKFLNVRTLDVWGKKTKPDV